MKTIKPTNIKLLFITVWSLLLFSLVSSLQAGVFWDDNLEIQSQLIPNIISKDEIQFTLCGKCERFLLLQSEMELELTYSTGKRTLTANQTAWHIGAPLKFSLPDNLKNLQSYRLTGKVRAILIPREGAPTGDLKKDLKVVSGYSHKIDLKWMAK
jgi:hypothetical protein